MAIDLLDVVLVDTLQTILGEPKVGFGSYYQHTDKWLDMYYLAIEGIACLTWNNKLARNAAVFLFLFRLVGITVFELTGAESRKLISFFPNLFENFFIYYILCEKYWSNLIPKKNRLSDIGASSSLYTEILSGIRYSFCSDKAMAMDKVQCGLGILSQVSPDYSKSISGRIKITFCYQ